MLAAAALLAASPSYAQVPGTGDGQEFLSIPA
jgi:hypothetical protein